MASTGLDSFSKGLVHCVPRHGVPASSDVSDAFMCPVAPFAGALHGPNLPWLVEPLREGSCPPLLASRMVFGPASTRAEPSLRRRLRFI